MSRTTSIDPRPACEDIVINNTLIAEGVDCEYYAVKENGYGSVEIDRYYTAVVSGIVYSGILFHNESEISWKITS